MKRKRPENYDEYRYTDTAQAKYDREHTTYIGLRIEADADADIMKALEGKARQTEVKRLIRIGLTLKG